MHRIVHLLEEEAKQERENQRAYSLDRSQRSGKCCIADTGTLDIDGNHVHHREEAHLGDEDENVEWNRSDPPPLDAFR